MARFTIVVGNGLGMALDSEYFSLSKGLETVWLGTSSFSQTQRKLVISAMPELSKNNYPSSEPELDKLQIAIVVVEWLKPFDSSQVKWLSDDASKLPEAFKRFVHEVGFYFHNSLRVLPNKFIDGISDFVKDTKSHVATLNYDNLLYDTFVASKVLNGYKGSLIDGFLKKGFNKGNLVRKYPPHLGWYLHLHGSPLFIGDKKLTRAERQDEEPTEKSHIVLTHVQHKSLVIASSNILSQYWEHFDEALDESDKIVLFGYSGCDTHLNKRIRSRSGEKPVYIIEWQGAGDKSSREKHWNEKLNGCNLAKIERIANILEFSAWSDL